MSVSMSTISASGKFFLKGTNSLYPCVFSEFRYERLAFGQRGKMFRLLRNAIERGFRASEKFASKHYFGGFCGNVLGNGIRSSLLPAVSSSFFKRDRAVFEDHAKIGTSDFGLIK